MAKMFDRECRDCTKRYTPTGKYQKFCDKCLKKRRTIKLASYKERILIRKAEQ